MNELSPEARNLIAGAAGADAPTADDRVRVRQRLALELGAAAFATTSISVGVVASSVSGSATTGTAGSAFASAAPGVASSGMLTGLAKLGLTRRDVAPTVNLFKSVRVDGSGALHLDGGLRPGTHVDLRAELDVLVTLANTPHPLDDRPGYHSSRVNCVAWLPSWRVDAVGAPPPALPMPAVPPHSERSHRSAANPAI